jgi:fermentation-respiration switch protein FrsA (DUF1100 family)
MLLFFVFYAKYFEKKGIYYPEKSIILTPKEIGYEFKDVYFNSLDGVRLNGWYVRSKNPAATLLFCHGNAGNISHRLEVIDLFCRLGLDVFIFDYRGYGKSEGIPSEKGLYADTRAAYGYLINDLGLKEKSVLIYGKSIGGNVSIELCSGINPAALISESAFTSALDMGKKLFPFLPLKWIISIRYDALSRIKDITIPKLIIHSREDEIIPYKQGGKLFESAPEPKEFYEMRGGHNDALFRSKEQYEKRIKAFINRTIGT